MTAADLHAALGGDTHIKTVKRDMKAIADGFPAVRLERYRQKFMLRIDHGELLESLNQKPRIDKKVCVACNEPKSLSEFHNCRSYTDGFFPECKMCKNRYNQVYYTANYKKERINARDGNGRFVKTTGRRKRRKYDKR